MPEQTVVMVMLAVLSTLTKCTASAIHKLTSGLFPLVSTSKVKIDFFLGERKNMAFNGGLRQTLKSINSKGRLPQGEPLRVWVGISVGRRQPAFSESKQHLVEHPALSSETEKNGLYIELQ